MFKYAYLLSLMFVMNSALMHGAECPEIMAPPSDGARSYILRSMDGQELHFTGPLEKLCGHIQDECADPNKISRKEDGTPIVSIPCVSDDFALLKRLFELRDCKQAKEYVETHKANIFEIASLHGALGFEYLRGAITNYYEQHLEETRFLNNEYYEQIVKRMDEQPRKDVRFKSRQEAGAATIAYLLYGQPFFVREVMFQVHGPDLMQSPTPIKEHEMKKFYVWNTAQQLIDEVALCFEPMNAKGERPSITIHHCDQSTSYLSDIKSYQSQGDAKKIEVHIKYSIS